MTPSNRQKNAAEALDWSRHFLAAADQLAAAGFYDRATSQVYYAIYHAVRGLLFTLGLEPRSHRGLRSLFRQHFVKSGEFSADDAILLDRLSQEREDADYVVSYRTDENEYAEWRARVEALIDRISVKVGQPPG